MAVNKLKICASLSYLLLYFNIASCSDYYIWKPLIVSSDHINNVTDNGMVFPAANDMVCSMIVSRFLLMKTYWYKEQVCSASSYQADYERMAVGVLVPNPKNVMVKIHGTCGPPFKLVAPYGCFTTTPPGTFNQTRKYCQSLGGDLWTFEHNSTYQYAGVVRQAIGVVGSLRYFGIFGQGTNWNWLNEDIVNTTKLSVYTLPPGGIYDGYCFSMGYTKTIFSHLCTSHISATCTKLAIV